MDSDQAATAAPGDEHFVEHIVQCDHDVRASEDVCTANGMKLLARGARVDGATRDRLLAHKLAKPLEQCLEVADAVSTESLEGAATRLLEEQPLLRGLYAGKAPGSVARDFARIPLSPPVRTLLTLYIGLPWAGLDHPVAVALLANGFARTTCPDPDAQERTLWIAGLMHDIGELYVDPAVLRNGRLQPEQWRHVIVHPLVGHRVLKDLQGAGRVVAEAVLQHHERRDGFGYPHRLAGDALSARGEALAAGEWLAGLMRSSRSPLTAASAAARLMPGSFNKSILQAVSSLSRGDEGGASTSETGDALAGYVRLAQTIERFGMARDWIEGLIAGKSAAAPVLAANHGRMQSIERSFISSGLAGEEPLVLFERLNGLGDPKLLDELSAIVRELSWRLRELERDTLLRASALPADDARAIYEMVGRIKPDETD